MFEGGGGGGGGGISNRFRSHICTPVRNLLYSVVLGLGNGAGGGEERSVGGEGGGIRTRVAAWMARKVMMR